MAQDDLVSGLEQARDFGKKWSNPGKVVGDAVDAEKKKVGDFISSLASPFKRSNSMKSLDADAPSKKKNAS